MMVFVFCVFFHLETDFSAYWAHFQNPLSPFRYKKTLGMGMTEELTDFLLHLNTRSVSGMRQWKNMFITFVFESVQKIQFLFCFFCF